MNSIMRGMSLSFFIFRMSGLGGLLLHKFYPKVSTTDSIELQPFYFLHSSVYWTNNNWTLYHQYTLLLVSHKMSS